MLIDIEKYVRQMLPPDLRKPKLIGLVTTLFSPFNSVIDEFNEYKYNLQFDTGTPGQVAVLEFILKSYVNTYIKVLSADGVKYDFRVLVPEGLSSTERGEVVRIIERYRLRSKRYEVTDLLDWGGGGSDPATGLAWVQVPIITALPGGGWIIQFSINKSDIFPLKIVNTTTGNVRLLVANFEPDANAIYSYGLQESGNYRVELGSLRGTATASIQTETNVKPAWLTKVVYNYDPNGHECSKYVNATADVEMLITEQSGVPVGGLGWQGEPWDNNTWIDGTTDFADGYNEVFRANGSSFGNGGILPGGHYKIKIRRAAVPGDIFVYNWIAPTTPQTKTEVVFEVVTGLCEYGPFIGNNSLSAEKNRLVFTFDARAVTSFLWRIKKEGLIVRSGTTAMVNGGGTPIFSPSNRPVLTFADLEAGNYTLEIEGGNCHSNVSSKAFTILPGATDPDPEEPSLTLLGTYEVTNSLRRMTYQKSPKFRITLNSDGTLTDTTPDTVHGTPTTCNGKTVFYMTRYRYLCSNGDGVRVYKSLEGIYFPDAIMTISRFDCDASKFPDMASFVAGYSGYPTSTGVNKYNAILSQITLTLHTLASPGIPLWLTVSRKLNFPYYVPNRAISKKIFAIESINRGDNPANYHSKDVRTQTQFNPDVPQPYTCRTWKWPWDLAPGMPLFTDSDLYNSLRGHINNFHLTADTVITDEFPENAQGQDPNIGSRVGLAYKGAMDLFREKFPGITKRETCLFGSYGGDGFYGLVDQNFLFKHSESEVLAYLTTKVHRSWDVGAGTWYGNDCAFYTSGQHKERNCNVAYYFYFGAARYNVPLEIVFANERIKAGTKTYGGQDNECDWIAFATILSQTLVKDESNNQMGVEEYRTGDLIPFEGGEVLSKYNTPIAANAGEHWDVGFWSCLVGRGTMLWDGGGSYGTDPTKISTYSPAGQYIAWITEEDGEQPYVSGQDGAPVNDVEGMKDTLYASVVDATMAGHQAALELEGYANTLYYASYTSSRKTFTAQPGPAGYHLNGFGPLNWGIMCTKHAADQKCGMAIMGIGPKGGFAAYNNGFLSQDEYEDDVTLSYGGRSVNLHRVYGGQTRYVKF